jgi:hypothetical protein
MKAALDLPSLRAAWWTVRAVRQARRRVRPDGLQRKRPLPPVPAVPERAWPGVAAVLRRLDSSCLVRAQVMQAWHASHGRRRDVVIGVTAPDEDFRAHAWLDGDEPCADSYTELTRISIP